MAQQKRFQAFVTAAPPAVGHRIDGTLDEQMQATLVAVWGDDGPEDFDGYESFDDSIGQSRDERGVCLYWSRAAGDVPADRIELVEVDADGAPVPGGERRALAETPGDEEIASYLADGLRRQPRRVRDALAARLLEPSPDDTPDEAG